MSKLQEFQDFIRSNGEKITGINVPVVLSDEQAKDAQLKFNFGWRVEIGVSRHSHGGSRPSGTYCGTSSEASADAHKAAEEFVSGRDPLFNERFLKILGPDVSKNFLIKNTSLNSAPSAYIGGDTCSNCRGTGCVRCRGCGGSGKTNCNSCGGRGRVSVSKYDSYSERTVYTTESCSSCWGSGSHTCTTCSGSGDVTCSPCGGSGTLYYSYTIDGEAKRSTKWFYTSSDYHEWTDDFVKRTGLNVVHCVNDITEIDVKDELDGCTFIYGFTAVLPTLQFTASIDKVDTKMCFAGKQNLTHDAGGVYDPAVWQVAQQLGAGSKSDDVVALATPAIKDIIEAKETKSKIALLEENWVSTDIKDAVAANYDSLIGQLKKQSIKGIVPKMLASLVKYAVLFFTLAVMIALLFPHFAENTIGRMGIMEYPQWIIGALTAEFAIFGIHPFANYAIALSLFYASYQFVKKFYWKNIGKAKTYALALGITLLLPHVCFSLYYNTISAFDRPPALVNALAGGAIILGLYLLAIGVKLPKKWYLKPIGLIAAAALYVGLQFVIAMLNGPLGIVPAEENYARGISDIMQPAIMFTLYNFIEIILLSVLCSYFLTRRRFWLNAKTAVADYNSPVLLKSMNMER